MNDNEPLIAICMGSSCFARGNSSNAAVIQRWLARQDQGGCETHVGFTGTLCEGLCREGPIVRVNGKVFRGVDPTAIEGIITHELGDN